MDTAFPPPLTRTLRLRAQPLSAAAFAPYGDVVASGAEGRWINGRHAWRSEAAAPVLAAGGGAAVLAVFRVLGRAAQGPWQQLERHALGSQSFFPLGAARCLLLVARGDTAPAPDTLAAFVSAPGQGWTLAPGTWHHALIALDDVDVAVLERVGPATDCDEAVLAEPVEIEL